MVTCLPISDWGAAPGHAMATIASLTTTTGIPLSSSASAKPRPARTDNSSVSKNSGVTATSGTLILSGLPEESVSPTICVPVQGPSGYAKLASAAPSI